MNDFSYFYPYVQTKAYSYTKIKHTCIQERHSVLNEKRNDIAYAL